MVLPCCEHDAINEYAGNLDFTRIERLGGRDPLDLRDDQTSGIAGRHGDRKIVEG